MKCPTIFCYGTKLYHVFATERLPPSPFEGIPEWVGVILPDTMGIHTWSTFYEWFGHRPLTGETTFLSDVLSFCLASYVSFVDVRESAESKGPSISFSSAGFIYSPYRGTHCLTFIEGCFS